MHVKICGISNIEDAEAAVRYGADALGFVFAPSKRRIKVQDAKRIIKIIGPLVACVGVFVNETAENILAIAKECELHVIQLHGDESPHFCKKLQPYKIIKAVPVDAKVDIASWKKFPVEALMLETKSAVRGGSGKTWDWSQMKGKKLPKPFFVTGGLSPENVKVAIRILKPYGVDVSSGVERQPGLKDDQKLRRFIQNAKGIL